MRVNRRRIDVVVAAIEKRGVSRRDVACAIGRSEGEVSRVLSGERRFTEEWLDLFAAYFSWEREHNVVIDGERIPV